MFFDKNDYKDEQITLDGKCVEYRAYRNIPYVDKPVNPEFQQLNIFVPKDLVDGGILNGYTIDTAPIFMPNQVGGYMPAEPGEPGYEMFAKDKINSIFFALNHGYVVAAPGIRGRIQKDAEGNYNGKAPACIVDHKAAVRFLHAFADDIPGDADKIITNGTSAGGALSSLMGSTGDHPDYEKYLEEIGAADASDAVFAASCYCPITNLEHADMAYEWQFHNVNDYRRMSMRLEGGRPSFTPEDGTMTDDQIRISQEEARLFPEYVNSLALKDAAGNTLSLDENGDGSFKEYVKSVILASAQTAIDQGIDLSDKEWLTIEDGKAVAMDFYGFACDITRMKNAPAFDDVTMNSPENDLFGNQAVNCRHFTEYSLKNSTCEGTKAEPEIIKMLNPMDYIEDEKAKTAKYFRIRHGESDRDTSLAISAILTLKLQETGSVVDYASPWGIPHSGDYDLKELFSWIDTIRK